MIETDVPMPHKRPGTITGQLHELLEAEIGNSVFFAGKKRESVAVVASRVGGGRFLTRSMGGGVRVWLKK